TPFDEDYVKDLKTCIPNHSRRWDPEDRLWIIDDRYEATVRRLLGIFFGYKYAPVDADPYRTLHLLPTAPPEVAKAAYRALAQIHHPDRGGSHEAMQRVNTAWETLSRS